MMETSKNSIPEHEKNMLTACLNIYECAPPTERVESNESVSTNDSDNFVVPPSRKIRKTPEGIRVVPFKVPEFLKTPLNYDRPVEIPQVIKKTIVLIPKNEPVGFIPYKIPKEIERIKQEIKPPQQIEEPKKSLSEIVKIIITKLDKFDEEVVSKYLDIKKFEYESNMKTRPKTGAGEFSVGFCRYMRKRVLPIDASETDLLVEFMKKHFQGRGEKVNQYRMNRSKDLYEFFMVDDNPETTVEKECRNYLRGHWFDFFAAGKCLTWLNELFQGKDRNRLWILLNLASIAKSFLVSDWKPKDYRKMPNGDIDRIFKELMHISLNWFKAQEKTNNI